MKKRIINIIALTVKEYMFKKKRQVYHFRLAPICDPAGTRTQGPYIKSVLLYQLSYGISVILLI